MEAILENLSMDATAGKMKAITDACDEGLGKTLKILVQDLTNRLLDGLLISCLIYRGFNS